MVDFTFLDVLDFISPIPLRTTGEADLQRALAERRLFQRQITPSEGLIREEVARSANTRLRGNGMGFFSSLLGIGKVLLRGAGILPPAAIKAPASIALPVADRARRAAAAAARRRTGAIAAGAGAGGLGLGLLAGDGDMAGTGGVGGNGRTFTRTIVQSVDSETGDVLRQEVRKGTPHLMNNDLAIAKRVFRLSSKLSRRLPKKIVRMSRAKMLTQQVVENALERASCPPLPCPSPR